MKEIRAFPTEIRMSKRQEDDAMPTLVSVAPPWDTLSGNLGGFREKFERGAFGDVDGLDVISTFEHDGRILLGRTPKTLSLSDTAAGLEYQVRLPETNTGRDLVISIERGDVRGSSFEFIVQESRWEEDDQGLPVRVVTSADLFQVGPVTNPAYRQGTDVALRSLAEWRGIDDFDELSLLELQHKLYLAML